MGCCCSSASSRDFYVSLSSKVPYLIAQGTDRNKLFAVAPLVESIALVVKAQPTPLTHASAPVSDASSSGMLRPTSAGVPPPPPGNSGAEAAASSLGASFGKANSGAVERRGASIVALEAALDDLVGSRKLCPESRKMLILWAASVSVRYGEGLHSWLQNDDVTGDVSLDDDGLQLPSSEEEPHAARCTVAAISAYRRVDVYQPNSAQGGSTAGTTTGANSSDGKNAPADPIAQGSKVWYIRRSELRCALYALVHSFLVRAALEERSSSMKQSPSISNWRLDTARIDYDAFRAIRDLIDADFAKTEGKPKIFGSRASAFVYASILHACAPTAQLRQTLRQSIQRRVLEEELDAWLVAGAADYSMSIPLQTFTEYVVMRGFLCASKGNMEDQTAPLRPPPPPPRPPTPPAVVPPPAPVEEAPKALVEPPPPAEPLPPSPKEEPAAPPPPSPPPPPEVEPPPVKDEELSEPSDEEEEEEVLPPPPPAPLVQPDLVKELYLKIRPSIPFGRTAADKEARAAHYQRFCAIAAPSSSSTAPRVPDEMTCFKAVQQVWLLRTVFPPPASGSVNPQAVLSTCVTAAYDTAMRSLPRGTEAGSFRGIPSLSRFDAFTTSMVALLDLHFAAADRLIERELEERHTEREAAKVEEAKKQKAEREHCKKSGLPVPTFPRNSVWDMPLMMNVEKNVIYWAPCQYTPVDDARSAVDAVCYEDLPSSSSSSTAPRAPSSFLRSIDLSVSPAQRAHLQAQMDHHTVEEKGKSYVSMEKLYGGFAELLIGNLYNLPEDFERSSFFAMVLRDFIQGAMQQPKDVEAANRRSSLFVNLRHYKESQEESHSAAGKKKQQPKSGKETQHEDERDAEENRTTDENAENTVQEKEEVAMLPDTVASVANLSKLIPMYELYKFVAGAKKGQKTFVDDVLEASARHASAEEWILAQPVRTVVEEAKESKQAAVLPAVSGMSPPSPPRVSMGESFHRFMLHFFASLYCAVRASAHQVGPQVELGSACSTLDLHVAATSAQWAFVCRDPLAKLRNLHPQKPNVLLVKDPPKALAGLQLASDDDIVTYEECLHYVASRFARSFLPYSPSQGWVLLRRQLPNPLRDADDSRCSALFVRCTQTTTAPASRADTTSGHTDSTTTTDKAVDAAGSTSKDATAAAMELGEPAMLGRHAAEKFDNGFAILSLLTDANAPKAGVDCPNDILVHAMNSAATATDPVALRRPSLIIEKSFRPFLLHFLVAMDIRFLHQGYRNGPGAPWHMPTPIPSGTNASLVSKSTFRALLDATGTASNVKNPDDEYVQLANGELLAKEGAVADFLAGESLRLLPQDKAEIWRCVAPQLKALVDDENKRTAFMLLDLGKQTNDHATVEEIAKLVMKPWSLQELLHGTDMEPKALLSDAARIAMSTKYPPPPGVPSREVVQHDTMHPFVIYLYTYFDLLVAAEQACQSQRRRRRSSISSMADASALDRQGFRTLADVVHRSGIELPPAPQRVPANPLEEPENETPQRRRSSSSASFTETPAFVASPPPAAATATTTGRHSSFSAMMRRRSSATVTLVASPTPSSGDESEGTARARRASSVVGALMSLKKGGSSSDLNQAAGGPSSGQMDMVFDVLSSGTEKCTPVFVSRWGAQAAVRLKFLQTAPAYPRSPIQEKRVERTQQPHPDSPWTQLRARIPIGRDGPSIRRRQLLFQQFDVSASKVLSIRDVLDGAKWILKMETLKEDLQPVVFRALCATKDAMKRSLFAIEDARGSLDHAKAAALAAAHNIEIITATEFPLFLRYLYRYLELFVMFDFLIGAADREVIDTVVPYVPPVGQQHSPGRRRSSVAVPPSRRASTIAGGLPTTPQLTFIRYQDFLKAAPVILKKWGLTEVDEARLTAEPDVFFREINEGRDGVLLFVDFSSWASRLGLRVEQPEDGSPFAEFQ